MPGQQTVALSGFNQDLIYGASEASAGAGTTTGVDNAGNVFYAANVPGTPGVGLPISGTIKSALNNGVTFQLQPYAGMNSLQLTGDATGTLTLTTPTKFSTLNFLANAADGASTLDLTLNFGDGSTTTVSDVSVPDWFGGAPYAINNLGARIEAEASIRPAPATRGFMNSTCRSIRPIRASCSIRSPSRRPAAAN